MQFPWDRDGSVRIGGNDAELVARWPGLLFDDTRDYINRRLSAATRRFPAEVMSRTGTELIELALAMTPAWSPRLRRLFERADPTTTFAINIRTSVPVQPWPSTTVTLIGDAIHTMTPGMGVGANTRTTRRGPAGPAPNLNVPRSPQGYPLLVQAGSSDNGKDVAARYAEAVFTAHQTLAEAQAFYADLKQRALRHGRDPDTIKVLPGIVPIVGATEADARALEVAVSRRALRRSCGLRRPRRVPRPGRSSTPGN